MAKLFAKIHFFTQSDGSTASPFCLSYPLLFEFNRNSKKIRALLRRKGVSLQKKYKQVIMDKITIAMSSREYKRYLAYKEADKIVRSIRRGLHEVEEARKGKRKLKSAYELAYEL
jgi:hypothetical protein